MVSRLPSIQMQAVSEPKRRGGVKKRAPPTLARLMDVGALRFDHDDDDGGMFAEAYARLLETALLATVRRNKLCKAQVDSLRQGNMELRAYMHSYGSDKQTSHSPTDTLTASM